MIGNTESVALRKLLRQQFRKLKIYVRNVDKLIRLFPTLTEDSRIQLCVGSIYDQKVIQECLDGANTIICTLRTEGFEPDIILQDSARSIVTALNTLKAAA